MARNQEKAQSMLYRFREAQASELGLVGRTDRRPRLASQCKDIRQCERWRGEILRDISRKVSKIQDAGLTDYEVRDLNDEINKLLREKNHWEKQIVFLGGANYRRPGGMVDAGGKSAPGARGYKYFGRAKDLPGVKELFENHAAETAENDSYQQQKPNPFADVGPNYFGEIDDKDEILLEFEREAEQEAWEDAIENLRDLGLEVPNPPPQPTPKFISLDPADDTTTELTTETMETIASETNKRKAAASNKKGSKKAKLDAKAAAAAAGTEAQEAASTGQAPKNGFMSVLDPQDLRPPVLLTAAELEKVIVAQQKKQLLKDFIGEE